MYKISIVLKKKKKKKKAKYNDKKSFSLETFALNKYN